MKVFTSGPVTAMRNGRLTTEYEDGIPQRGVMPGRYGIRLRQPVRKKILEVTGITAGPADNVKLAEFTWKWDFSHLSKGIDSTTATGVAVFHRYDDGWRIDVTSTKFLDAKLIIRE